MRRWGVRLGGGAPPSRCARVPARLPSASLTGARCAGVVWDDAAGGSAFGRSPAEALQKHRARCAKAQGKVCVIAGTMLPRRSTRAGGEGGHSRVSCGYGARGHAAWTRAARRGAGAGCTGVATPSCCMAAGCRPAARPPCACDVGDLVGMFDATAFAATPEDAGGRAAGVKARARHVCIEAKHKECFEAKQREILP